MSRNAIHQSQSLKFALQNILYRSTSCMHLFHFHSHVLFQLSVNFGGISVALWKNSSHRWLVVKINNSRLAITYSRYKPTVIRAGTTVSSILPMIRKLYASSCLMMLAPINVNTDIMLCNRCSWDKTENCLEHTHKMSQNSFLQCKWKKWSYLKSSNFFI